MTTIIKNQIVKQLAKFTKNLSPSKINLKFLKGEGELRNLELNEQFLTELLELPPFLRLTRAVCNKISAKIHWTRLKTDPIRLFLDCVEVEMEMMENVQDFDHKDCDTKQNSTNAIPPKSSEYGFAEKVVDGMHVTINSVIMAFRTPTFKATFQMSHLSVHSTDHNWGKATLRNTRIKDDAGKEVLTFKQITFGTLRIDADALYKGNDNEKDMTSLSPLRLITSAAKLNIVIKKRLTDCSVISARLHAILDDVLWVLTHAQLRAVASFAKSVVQVVEKSKKLEPAPSVASDDSTTTQSSYSDTPNEYYQKPNKPDTSPSSLFQRQDVKETSYRVTTGKIDVHLCDDTPMNDTGQSGSMQIVVNNLSFEHYPYHLALTSRVNWPSHNDASLTRAQWVQELFTSYKKVMGDVVKKSGKSSQRYEMSSRLDYKETEQLSTKKKRPHTYLYECAFVISCEDFIIMPVTTSDKAATSTIPFLCSDKKSLYLPNDISALQFDYTLYFYPGQEDAKVPQPNLFCQLNPLHLTMDDLTCIWFHRFVQSIRSGFMWAEELIASQGAEPRHIDVRIDGLMPKITLPCPSDPNSLYDQFRPQAIQIHMSSFRASNTRIGSEFKQSNLVETLDVFLKSKLYTDGESFPNHVMDTVPLPHNAWLKDFSVLTVAGSEEYSGDYQYDHASVVWMLNTRQCWCDFIGIDETAGRPQAFVEPFPLHVCMCYPITHLPEASLAYNSRPSVLPLHRSPSDPYCRHPKGTSSARSTPVSSPGSQKLHKTRSTTSVNIPVLSSDYLPMYDKQEINSDNDYETYYVAPETGDITVTDVSAREHCSLAILLHVPSSIRVKLDHFQYVFLMRLQERFISLRDTLYSDSEKFERQRRTQQSPDVKQSSPELPRSDGINISLVSKGAEVSILIPATVEEEEVPLKSTSDTQKEQSSDKSALLPHEEGKPDTETESEKGQDLVKHETSSPRQQLENSEWTIVDNKGQIGSPEDILGGERSPSDGSSTYDSESFSSQDDACLSDRSSPGRSVATVVIRSKVLECAVTSEAEDFAFKLLIQDCFLKEGAVQNLESLLNQRSRRDGFQFDNGLVRSSEIKIRYALGSTLDRNLEGAVENGVAHIIINDVKTTILQSNLDGVLECVSDEVDAPPPFIPVIIDLRDIDFTINVDSKPRLLSLPPALPTRLHIDQASLLRTAAGGFDMRSSSDGQSSMSTRFMAIREENNRLLKDLDTSNEAREVLETEKERLLITVKRLTDELVKSNRENDQLQALVRNLKENTMS